MPDKEKSFKDKMAWVRDQVHLLRRLQKELTGRIRSLRFFEGVRNAQRRKCSLPTAQVLSEACFQLFSPVQSNGPTECCV